MGCGGSRIGPQPDKASAKSSPPSFAALIAAGTMVPDEREGPYALGSYHANFTGVSRGYKFNEGRKEWMDTNKAIMALPEVATVVTMFAARHGLPRHTFSPVGLLSEHAALLFGAGAAGHGP